MHSTRWEKTDPPTPGKKAWGYHLLAGKRIKHVSKEILPAQILAVLVCIARVGSTLA